LPHRAAPFAQADIGIRIIPSGSGR
jgi:hypothetical protein